MRLLFLGSGSAYTVGTDNFQSNMLLSAGGDRRLLIDCGSDIRWSLARQGLSHRDITDIYISHLHADHIGGLECIAFQTRFDPTCRRPRLYLEQSLIDPLWSCSLRGGLGVITAGETRMEEFFEVVPLSAGQPFAFDDARLEPIALPHVVSPAATVHSHGLLIEHGGRSTLITTDTSFDADLLARCYARADLIFHDCELGERKTAIHAHYDELAQLPAAVRGRMWLYDFPPGPLPDARAAGFLGFVQPGQCFDLDASAIQPTRVPRTAAS